MPDRVRACDEHGFFADETCPDCGARGRRVLSGERRRRVSKFASGALRHFPEDAGLTLDDAGWTPLDELVAAVSSRYEWADGEAVEAVIATDPNGRFERDGEAGDDRSADDVTGRVRAAYGHSVDVALDAGEGTVPDTLYHGTAPHNRESILADGLRPMGRQQVHLSGTVEAARDVGRRHTADPVVFEVDAAGLRAAGHDVTERGRDVYTTDRVPPAYLVEL